MVISGESNINHFSFSFTQPPGDRSSGLHSAIWQTGDEIAIPVREFEASNPHMYNDFLNQLQAKEYPYITVSFPGFELKNVNDLIVRSQCKVMITLAGVMQQYTIDCFLMNCGDHFSLRGSKIIRLTDFHISPPVKLNGLIKVRDEITVSFGIILNFTPDNSFSASR
jgi:hypothetical protein